MNQRYVIILFFVSVFALIFMADLSTPNQFLWNKIISLNKSSSLSSTSSGFSKVVTPSKKCLCDNEFSHAGYRVGWGDNGFGLNDKIGVQPGKYCSEYCAFVFEHY